MGKSSKYQSKSKTVSTYRKKKGGKKPNFVIRDALERENVSDIQNQPCCSKTLDKPSINYFEEDTRIPNIQEQNFVIRDALERENVSDIQNQPCCSKTLDKPSINYFEEDTRIPNIQEQNFVIRDALERENVSDIQNQPCCSKTLDKPSINYFEEDTRIPNIQEQKSFNLEGRRIVDVGYLFDKIAKINHRPFDCNFSNLVLTGEQKNGYFSKFIFTCEICGIHEEIESEDPTNASVMDVNTSAVVAVVNSGQGYAQLDTFSAIMNLPNMSNKLYQKLHGEVHRFTSETAWKAMSLAAEEEAKLAIANGDVSKDGVPMISVVADGAWSKRSYKTNYNALSGVGCIVGEKTKKVIFLGIRNKFCAVCSRTEATSVEPSTHKCFKNWEGTSTAMESDIILEGFKQSIDMHKLIYHKLIGDGDSSVIKKLNAAKPYGSNILIKKIECKNHILRNYISKIRDMAAKRKSSSGKIVPGFLRKILKDNKLRLRYAITKAIEHWKNVENLTQNQKAKCLKKDIDNGPYHVFGFHDKCDPYFCKPKHNNINYVPEMENCGLWQDISAAKNLVAFNSDSLMYDVTNNYVESYNSIVAKFVGGKRINYSLRGSYNTRCMTAVSSFNFGPEYLRQLHKAATKSSPGKFTKNFIRKLQKAKHVRSTKRRSKLNIGPSTKLTRSKKFFGPDKDYGDLDELGCAELQMSPEELEAKQVEILTNLKLNYKEICELERCTTDQNKCDIWHKARKYRLTASNFGRVCKLRISTPRTNTVKYILYAEDLTSRSPAMTYGIKYEPIAKEAFELQWNVNVLPAGLFVDKQFNFLAGSPDGLVGDDDLIEIKCPYNSKDLTPYEGVVTKKIKFLTFDSNGDLKLNRNNNYYYQIQGQLRVANKRSCYFVVWTQKDMFVEIIKRDDDFWKNNMEAQLLEFYNDHLLKEIVNPTILK